MQRIYIIHETENMRIKKKFVYVRLGKIFSKIYRKQVNKGPQSVKTRHL